MEPGQLMKVRGRHENLLFTRWHGQSLLRTVPANRTVHDLGIVGSACMCVEQCNAANGPDLAHPSGMNQEFCGRDQFAACSADRSGVRGARTGGAFW